MGQIGKNGRNELFKIAVDYLFKEHLVSSQGELAEKIGISESALSRIMNNKKFVSDDTLRKMNEAFGGIFNMAYFRGESIYFLIEDMLEEKAQQIGMTVVPTEDYKYSPPQESGQPDQSSLYNAALSAQIETIAILKQSIDDLKEQHQRIIDEKDARIRELQQLADERLHRIAELRRTIDANVVTGLSAYPFQMGSAEHRLSPSDLPTLHESRNQSRKTFETNPQK